MFKCEYSVPSKIRGTIKTNSPIMSLGRFTDIDGEEWDVRAVMYKGKEHNYVSAVPASHLHPYFSSTAYDCCIGIISQNWYPFKIEVVE